MHETEKLKELSFCSTSICTDVAVGSKMGQCMAGLTQAQVKNLSSLQQLAESKVTERYHCCFQNDDDDDDNSVQFNSRILLCRYNSTTSNHEL